MALRRARGTLLRLTRHRTLALVTGAALAVPAAWIEFTGRYTTWWVDGLCLVLGATGVAIFWAGISGMKPDWVDEG